MKISDISCCFFLGAFQTCFLHFCLLQFCLTSFSFSFFVVHFPGKCMSHTSSTYTFTTCRILHPSDELTSVSARYTSSKQSYTRCNPPSYTDVMALKTEPFPDICWWNLNKCCFNAAAPNTRQTPLSDWTWQVKWWGRWFGVVSYGCHGQSRAFPLNTHGWGRAWERVWKRQH